MSVSQSIAVAQGLQSTNNNNTNKNNNAFKNLPKLNLTAKQNLLKTDESPLQSQKRGLLSERLISPSTNYEDQQEIELIPQHHLTEQGSRKSNKVLAQEMQRKGNFSTNVKMRVEEYMNAKLSDNLFKGQQSLANQSNQQKQQQQFNNFANHKSSVLNGIEDIKDILNQRSQLTLYMQSLNNPKMSSKGLVNSKYQIKVSQSQRSIQSNLSQSQFHQNTIENQSIPTSEGFTALLNWDKTPKRYRDIYMYSQRYVDSVKQGNYNKAQNYKQAGKSGGGSSKVVTDKYIQPNQQRKKSQSMHLSPREYQREVNEINKSIITNQAYKNIAYPAYFKSLSPQSIKLSDLNVVVRTQKRDNSNNNNQQNSQNMYNNLISPISAQQQEDFVVSGANQDNTMYTSRKSNSLNASQSPSMMNGGQNENKWQKVNLTGTAKAKELLNHQSSNRSNGVMSQHTNIKATSVTQPNNNLANVGFEVNQRIKKLDFNKFKSINSQDYNSIQDYSPSSPKSPKGVGQTKLPLINHLRNKSLSNQSQVNQQGAKFETDRDRSASRVDSEKSEKGDIRKKFKHIGQSINREQEEEEEQKERRKKEKFMMVESLVSIDETQYENTLKKENIDRFASAAAAVDYAQFQKNPSQVSGGQRRSLTEDQRYQQTAQTQQQSNKNRTQTSMNTQLSLCNLLWKQKNPAGVQLDHSLNYQKKSHLTRFDIKEGLKTYQIRDLMEKKIMVNSMNQKTELRQIYVVYVQIKSSEEESAHLEENLKNTKREYYADSYSSLSQQQQQSKTGQDSSVKQQKRVFCVETFFIPVFKKCDDYLEVHRDTEVWVELLKRMLGIEHKQPLFFTSAFGDKMTYINELHPQCNIIFFNAIPPSISLVKQQFRNSVERYLERSPDIKNKFLNLEENSMQFDDKLTGQNNLMATIYRIYQLNQLEREKEITFLSHLNQFKTKEDIYLALNSRSHILKLFGLCSNNSRSSSKHRHANSVKSFHYFTENSRNKNVHKPMKRLDSFYKVEKFPKEENNQGFENIFLTVKKDNSQDKKVDIIFYNKLKNQKSFSKIMNRLYKPISEINLNGLEKKTSLSRQELINLYSQYKSYVAMEQDTKNPKSFKINMNALQKQSYGASLRHLERVEPLVTLLRKEKQLLKGQFGDIINEGIFTEQDYKLTWEEFLQDYIEQQQITNY